MHTLVYIARVNMWNPNLKLPTFKSKNCKSQTSV